MSEKPAKFTAKCRYKYEVAMRYGISKELLRSVLHKEDILLKLENFGYKKNNKILSPRQLEVLCLEYGDLNRDIYNDKD